ncbi:hypothetical protein O6H91_23G061100 [Diphasiastrum complanatum]|uniref:Uncharacterized protein n=1 Tax=Diphasiastrum complanatum TaxID=34168 RepID=A0ACC2ABD4_DIPCM|nr:hypothetical protein O6H91_23G061100 [Diphasiastrum complanatum]
MFPIYRLLWCCMRHYACIQQQRFWRCVYVTEKDRVRERHPLDQAQTNWRKTREIALHTYTHVSMERDGGSSADFSRILFMRLLQIAIHALFFLELPRKTSPCCQ